jgi:3,4-dihydroxy-2-butanone 4-phosphate synthase
MIYAFHSGYICIAMPGEALERLDLPLMVTHNTETFRTAYTITVDYSIGACCFLIDDLLFVSFSDFLMTNG